MKGVPRSEAERQSIKEGIARERRKREEARAAFVKQLKEIAELAKDGAPGIIGGAVAAGLATTPYSVGVLMALPFAPIRLLSIPGLGGGTTLHDEMRMYFAKAAQELTNSPSLDTPLRLEHRLAFGALAGLFVQMGFEFVKQLGGIAPG